MAHYVPGRPDNTEYTPWFANYIATIDGPDVIGSLARQRDELMALLTGLEGSFSYAPGKWTVTELLGHVTDAERIFGFRVLSVARGEKAVLPTFEQDDYMATAGFASRSLADVIAEFAAVRDASIRLLRGLPEDAWMRRGQVGEYSVTTRGLAFVLAGHENHHTRILRDKYVIATI